VSGGLLKVWQKFAGFDAAQRQFIGQQARQRFLQGQRGSVLGKAWIVIQPLATILVYTLVFSQVMQQRLSGRTDVYAYSLFLCAGLLPWQLFSEVMQKTQASLLDHAHILRKTAVPLGAFPLISLQVALMNFGVIYALFLLWALVFAQISMTVLFTVLPSLILLLILAWIWGFALAIAHVFFRDVGQILALVLQFGFWMTPVVYPLSVVPAWLQNILVWMNPLVVIIQTQQNAFLGLEGPPWWHWLPFGLWLLLGCLFLRHLLRERADELVDLL
jgi:lipopolysaccharide transport system permease protein